MKNMMKKLGKGLTIISVLSWAMNIIVFVNIMLAYKNGTSFRLVINDFTFYRNKEMIMMSLLQLGLWLTILTGSSSLISHLLKWTVRRQKEEIEEVEES